ncbi:MAG: hypothetical protein QNJ45_13380 [Ardenticatenaceae bacterium]|nr:hypothetical protein [Ardenticatenaceae bacterium]
MMRFSNARLITIVIIWLSFFLSLEIISAQAPTFDEQGFIVRGVTYLRGEFRTMRVGHPLGLNGWNALLAAADPEIASPSVDPSWDGRDFHHPAERFMWSSGNQVEKVLFLTRIQSVWLLLLLGVIVYRWLSQLTGKPSIAILGLVFILLDPNLLAHGSLATTDLGLTAAAVMAAYAFWWYWQKPGQMRAVIVGFAVALLNNTKFTAGLFDIFLILTVIILLFRQVWTDGWRPVWRRHRPLVLVAPLTAFLFLWAMYGFQIGRLPDELPMLSQLGGLTLPLSHHLEQLLDIGNRSTQGAASFLIGEYSDRGWWYYFPVALAVKTPLPTLVLWVMGVGCWVLGDRCWVKGEREVENGHRSTSRDPQITVDSHWANLFFIGPAVGFFLFSLTTSVNIGYRHIMPITPLLTIWALSRAGHSRLSPRLAPLKHGFSRLRSLVSGLFRNQPLGFMSLLGLWLMILTISIAPHPLAFFNALGGGPENGWRMLVDSNIDWGQDLGNLATWLAENKPDETVYLSYFGEARPDYYGINFIGLDGFPPRLMHPQADPLIPYQPSAGVYAISVTNLQGVKFNDRDKFAWFRDKEPLARIGYSIYVYEVKPFGEPAAVAFGGGLQPRDIPQAVWNRWETNQLEPRWFGGEDGWLIPGDATGTIFMPESLTVRAPNCLEVIPVELWPEVVRADGVSCLPAAESQGIAFKAQESTLTLLETSFEQMADQLHVTTLWHHQGDVQPLKIFVHLIDEEDQIIAQWDGFEVISSGWQDGDLIFHRHELSLPPESTLNSYRLSIGLYNPASGTRWTLPDGTDRFLLEQVEVE